MVAADHHRPLVLLVDDVTDVRMALRFLLETQEFRVVEADTGQSALDRVKQGGVDAVVTDVYMPGAIDGVEFIRQIRESDRGRLPIIAYSGDPHVAARSSLQVARSLGADATFLKPVKQDELIVALRRMTGGGPALRPQ